VTFIYRRLRNALAYLLQMSSSDSDSTSNADSPHASDLYFDDEFGSERIMSRDRHLRLQTTLGLGHTASMNLSDEFRSPSVKDSGVRAHQQRKAAGHRDQVAGTQKTRVNRETAATTAFTEGNSPLSWGIFRRGGPLRLQE